MLLTNDFNQVTYQQSGRLARGSCSLLLNGSFGFGLGYLWGILTKTNTLVSATVFSVSAVAFVSLGLIIATIGKNHGWSHEKIVTLTHAFHILNALAVLVAGVALGFFGQVGITLSLLTVCYHLWKIGQTHWMFSEGSLKSHAQLETTVLKLTKEVEELRNKNEKILKECPLILNVLGDFNHLQAERKKAENVLIHIDGVEQKEKVAKIEESSEKAAALVKLTAALRAYNSPALLRQQEEKLKRGEVIGISDIVNHIEKTEFITASMNDLLLEMVEMSMTFMGSTHEEISTGEGLYRICRKLRFTDYGVGYFHFYIALLKKVLHFKPNPNVICSTVPSINFALYSNDPMIIELFALAHANFNIRDLGTDDTPLMLAAKEIKITPFMMALLLEHGADPTLTKGGQITALQLAKQSFNIESHELNQQTIQMKIDILLGYEQDASTEQKRKTLALLIRCSCLKQAANFVRTPHVIPNANEEKEAFFTELLKALLFEKNVSGLQYLLETFHLPFSEEAEKAIELLDSRSPLDAALISVINNHREAAT